MGSVEAGGKFRDFFEFHARCLGKNQNTDVSDYAIQYTWVIQDGRVPILDSQNWEKSLIGELCCCVVSVVRSRVPSLLIWKTNLASTKQNHYLKEKIKMKSSEIYCSVQMKSGKFSNICLHLMLLRQLTCCLDCTVTCDSSRLLFPLCPLPELPCGGLFAHHIWTLLCSVSAAQSVAPGQHCFLPSLRAKHVFASV